MERRKQLAKKKVMRWMVIATIYMILIWAGVTVVLGSVWMIKHTVYGIWLLLGACLVLGGWLFFRFMREEKLTVSAVY